ncbi:MAG TPA: hypothetical protein VGL92_02685, partial [Acidimicrobiia bacterium]
DSVDAFWHRKYTRDDEGRLVRVPAGGADGESLTRTTEHGGHGDGGAGGGGHGGHGSGIHMPSPSYYPALAALALPLLGFGAIYGWWWGALGVIVLQAGVFGWAGEPLTEPLAE